MKKTVVIIICFFANITFASNINNKNAANFLKFYLKEINAVAIDFTQEDSKGKKAAGKLLINKPYRFRCNYYPPFPLIIIGSKNFVSMYDYDMQQVSRIKANENIFNFLLEDKEYFDKHFVFESIIDEQNFLQITIYHTLTDRRSEITFDKSNKQIKLLRIFEDDNIISIFFNKIVKVQKFDDDLFKLKDPNIFGIPEQLPASEIEKKYKPIS